MEIAPPPRSKRTSLPRQVSTPVIRRPPNKPPKPPAGCAAAASIREQQPPPVINHRNHNNKNCQQQQSVGGVNQILINSSLVRTTTNTTTSEDEDHIYERKLLTLRNRRTSLKIIFRAISLFVTVVLNLLSKLPNLIHLISSKLSKIFLKIM